jgi:integrase
MKPQFSFIIDRRKKTKTSSDFGLIELKIYHNKKSYYHSTKIKVPIKDWITEDAVVSKRNSNHETLNEDLSWFIEKLTKARREAEYKNLEFSITEIKAILNPKNEKSNSFTTFALQEINSNNFIKEVTKRSQRNTIRRLIIFNANSGVDFNLLTVTFILNFINHLKGENIAQNTIRKHNKNLKSLIEKAIRKGLYEKANPCKEIKIKEIETRNDVLNWEEVELIENYTFELYEEKLEIIRDMFLFCCYTGLRISDLTVMKKEYIKKTNEGVVLDFFTVKVNKHAIIPLHSLFPIEGEQTTKPLKILNKYFNPNQEFVFPKLSEQYFNRELKVIGSLIGVSFKLTSHIGRKSFATYMARKISTPTLKRLLQHSNIKTTERYVHLSDKMVNEDLKSAHW